jgi:spore maturation protein CgeB
MKNIRILTTGESWIDGNARACTSAFRKMGCDVAEVNVDNYVPQWRKKWARGVARVVMPVAIREFNEAILRQARQQRPAFMLAFKGPYVEAQTLREMRQLGIRLYNYYPDTSAFTHGPYLPKALPEYDCTFYTKPFWDADVRSRIKLRESVFLHHGYDTDLHQPWELTTQDVADYEADVVVIGSQTDYKEQLLRELLRLMPKLDLKVWGHRWETTVDRKISEHWQRDALTGQAYGRALQAARINLAITSGIVAGASQGDFVTMRTFQIPACRGFMLHERNPEVLELFEEGKEMACYSSAEELAAKIDYYLTHPEERKAIAEAGYNRCVPAYSYDNRMQTILDWHSANRLTS